MLMEEFERIAKVSEDKNIFRQNILTQLGVYALENPAQTSQGMDYAKVFPDLLRRLRDHYIDEHTAMMRKVYDAMVLFDALEQPQKTSEQIEAEKQARLTLANMAQKYGYSEQSAKEAFVYLVQKRY
jgi:hypothetical protein